ncbi:113_t:CDS:2 [Ambispora leptoticha]|uniref:Kinetochore protein NDC80 n=1 Tax=Ambispora leptoticha TaxID=144679 RepID=A0A9N8ZDE1_9GLOM|nr:113_t:CDS:2 [Ambispora leptoticha]
MDRSGIPRLSQVNWLGGVPIRQESMVSFDANISAIGRLSRASMNGIQKPTTDPRPIRNKTWQQNAANYILQTLRQFNPDNGVSLKALIQKPTSKDLEITFKILYEVIDPTINWGPTSKFDELVVQLVQGLRYPFGHEIRKQVLASLNSAHSWPILLAMLKWLADVAKKYLILQDAFNKERQAEPTLIRDHWVRNLSESYELFLNGNDDFSKPDRKLKQIFDQEINEYEHQNQMLKSQIIELEEKKQQLTSDESLLDKARKDHDVLKSDKEKFILYHQHCKSKKEKLIITNKQLAEKLEEEVEQMLQNRVEINNNLQKIIAKKEQTTCKVQETEKEFAQEIAKIEECVQHFNMVAADVNLKQGTNLEIEMDIDSEKIILTDLEDLRRNVLMKLRKDNNAQHHQIIQEKCELERKLDESADQLSSLQLEIQRVERNNAAILEQLEDSKQKFEENVKWRMETLRQNEKHMADIRLEGKKNLMAMREKRQELQIQCDRLEKNLRDQIESHDREYKKAVDEQWRLEQYLAQQLISLVTYTRQILTETKTNVEEDSVYEK